MRVCACPCRGNRPTSSVAGWTLYVRCSCIVLMAKKQEPDGYAAFVGTAELTREFVVQVMVVDPHAGWGKPIRPFYSRQELLAGVPMLIVCENCDRTREVTLRLAPASMPGRKELAPRATTASASSAVDVGCVPSLQSPRCQRLHARRRNEQ